MSSVAEKLQRKSQKAVGAKQVRLRLVYVDFWSVTKLSFLVALVLAIVFVVVVFLAWMILTSTGIFTDLDKMLGDVTGGGDSFSLLNSFSLVQVLGFSIIVGLLNTICGTVLGALAALLYNVSVKLTGGILVGFTNN